MPASFEKDSFTVTGRTFTPPETLPLLGDKSFHEDITEKHEQNGASPTVPLELSLPELAQRVARHFQLDTSIFNAPSRRRQITKARSYLAYLAIHHARYSTTVVARFFQTHPSSVSRAVQNALAHFHANPKNLKQLLRQNSNNATTQD
jgi:chromosomal replication initiation ATPase DnaA